MIAALTNPIISFLLKRYLPLLLQVLSQKKLLFRPGTHHIIPMTEPYVKTQKNRHKDHPYA